VSILRTLQTLALALFVAAGLSATPGASFGQSSGTATKTKEEAPRTGSTDAAGSTKSSTQPSQSDADPDTFRIGVDDELQISVWREPELSTPVTVRPDGMITLPLLNDVPVLGLTPKELQKLLTEKLKPFVTEPQVTVIVRAIRSRRVFLVGQVPHPGSYQLSGRRTVLQIIAEAGGLNLFAKSTSIYVLRNENGRQIRIPFNYKNAIKGGKDAEIVLLAGDMVVVP
jgi:polysaccharide export outer membrane protein